MTGSDASPRFEGARLIVGEEGERESLDARFLLSTLLVYVAKGDGNISSVETDKIIHLLSARYKHQGPRVLEQLTASIMALADQADLVQSLREIAKGLSAEEKMEIFSLATQVAMADEELSPGEERAINLAGQILGLSQDTIYARLRAISPDS